MALGGVPVERLAQHRLRLIGRVAGPPRRELRPRRVGSEGVQLRGRGEELVAAEQLVGDAGQRVDVGGGRGAPPVPDLGGDIGRRADHRVAGLGVIYVAILWQFRAQQASDAEVGDQRLAEAIEQDVGRLQVAMDHAPPVRVVQRPSRVAQQLHRVEPRQRPLLLQASRQGACGQVHGDIQPAVGLAHLEDRDDVRVPQGGARARLLVEAPYKRRVAQQVGAQDFERDLSFQRRVCGSVDCRKTAAADSLQDRVFAELLSVGHNCLTIARSGHSHICLA